MWQEDTKKGENEVAIDSTVWPQPQRPKAEDTQHKLVPGTHSGYAEHFYLSQTSSLSGAWPCVFDSCHFDHCSLRRQASTKTAADLELLSSHHHSVDHPRQPLNRRPRSRQMIHVSPQFVEDS